MNTKAIIKQVTKIKNRLAKDRDDLRAIQSEVEELLDGKEDNLYDLESIIDDLSKFV